MRTGNHIFLEGFRGALFALSVTVAVTRVSQSWFTSNFEISNCALRFENFQNEIDIDKFLAISRILLLEVYRYRGKAEPWIFKTRVQPKEENK